MGRGPKLEPQTQIALGEALRGYLLPSWNGIPAQLVDLWRRVQEIDQQTVRERRGGRPSPEQAGDVQEIRILQPHCFDPETLTSLEAAFDDGWATLLSLGGSQVTKEQLAERILELAAEGERSVSRLTAKALISVIAPQAKVRSA